MYCETIFSVRNKCITNTVRATPSLSPTTKAACPPALAVHTWFRALAQAASKRRLLLRATLPHSCRTASRNLLLTYSEEMTVLRGTKGFPTPRPSVDTSTVSMAGACSGCSEVADLPLLIWQRSSRGMSSLLESSLLESSLLESSLLKSTSGGGETLAACAHFVIIWLLMHFWMCDAAWSRPACLHSPRYRCRIGHAFCAGVSVNVTGGSSSRAMIPLSSWCNSMVFRS